MKCPAGNRRVSLFATAVCMVLRTLISHGSHLWQGCVVLLQPKEKRVWLHPPICVSTAGDIVFAEGAATREEHQFDFFSPLANKEYPV